MGVNKKFNHGYYNVPDPSTVSFTDVNAYFDRAFIACKGFQNSAGTIPNKIGQPCIRMVDQIGGSKVMTFTNATPSLTPNNSGSFTSSFPVPGAPHGGVPLYYPYDGGYINVFNGWNKSYAATNESPDVAPQIDLVYVCMKIPTTGQENFHSGFGFPQFKLTSNTGRGIFGINSFVDTYTGTAGNPNTLEYAIIWERYTNDGSRTSEIFITDSRGDLVSQGTFTDATGGFIRSAGIGSSGHAQNHRFLGMWYTLGRNLNSTQRSEVNALLKTKFKIGQKPSLPFCIPGSITFNSTSNVWSWSYTYFPGASGLAEDKNQTTIRVYIGLQPGAEQPNTGNPLDNQKYLRDSSGFVVEGNGNLLSIDRDNFTHIFPSESTTNEFINIGITVRDTAGNTTGEIPGVPLNNSQA